MVRNYPEGEGPPSDNLYIQGLSAEFDTESVQKFFGAIGNVVQCKSFGHGYALVRFSSGQEATNVKTHLSGQQPIGCSKPLIITYAKSEKKDDWNCPRCGDLQYQKNLTCRMCGCPRPQAADAPLGPPPAPGATDPPPAGLPHYAEEGDWKCPSCGDLQFKRNTNCRLCGTPAPGAGAMPVPSALPVFGKAKGKVGKSVDSRGAPYPCGGGGGSGKGAGKKSGPMCTIAEFIGELITGGLPGGDFDFDKNALQVGGLPPDTTDQDLYTIFSTFGPMPPRGARIRRRPDGACDGVGFVNYMESKSADMAITALSGIQLPDGQRLHVSVKIPAIQDQLPVHGMTIPAIQNQMPLHGMAIPATQNQLPLQGMAIPALPNPGPVAALQMPIIAPPLPIAAP